MTVYDALSTAVDYVGPIETAVCCTAVAISTTAVGISTIALIQSIKNYGRSMRNRRRAKEFLENTPVMFESKYRDFLKTLE